MLAYAAHRRTGAPITTHTFAREERGARPRRRDAREDRLLVPGFQCARRRRA